MSLRWLNVLFGGWMLATGLVAGPRAPGFGDHVFLGLAIFLVAFLAMALPRLQAVNVVLGAWAVLSPFVLGYLDAGLAVNDIVVGILVCWVALTPPRPHRPRGRAAPAT
jgi:hypothetical protein